MEEKNYQDFVKKYRDIDLNVRKNNASFIRRLLEHLGLDIGHDDFKRLINGTKEIISETEYRIKFFYDAYDYLLSNPNMVFSKNLLSRFFFILMGKPLEEHRILAIQAAYHDFGNLPVLQRILKTHFSVYSALEGYEDVYRTGSAFLILNSLLVRHKLVPIRFFAPDFEKYERVKAKYLEGDIVPAVEFLLDKLRHERTQPKDYDKKLEPLTISEIVTKIKDNSALIGKLYKTRSVILFGSFAKKTPSYDSDIDLGVVFEEDISYEEKEQYAEGLKEYLFVLFNRFVDVQEINGYIEEKLLVGFQKYIKVF